MPDNVDSILSSGALWGHSNSTIYPRSERFNFFNTILRSPEWSLPSFNVLDIGGNHGNFIHDAVEKNAMAQSQYFCLDVNKDAINIGKETFPDAHWDYRNAFNHMYNPSGEDNLAFPYSDNMFNVVMAYSVYSHTTFEQLMFDIKEMIRVCRPLGHIAFTVVDYASVQFFTNKRITDYPGRRCLTQSDFKGITDYTYFVDCDLKVNHMYGKSKVDHLVTVYNLDWLSDQLNAAGIDHVMKFPTTGHVQRTVIIQKPKRTF